jgi:AhpD family alkylhydroperoxidase
MKFTVHTIDTAPEASKADLQAAQKAIGFIPNLLGIMAEAPISLKAYLELSDLLRKSSFSPIEQETIMLAGSVTNECGYCVAAHSTDARLEALRLFASDVVSTRGRVSDSRIQQFLDAGFTRQNVLEVVFGAAMKSLSNYTNHIAETPVDKQFAPHSWEATTLATA